MDAPAEGIKGFLRDNVYLITTAVLAVGGTWILWKRIKKKPKRQCGVDYPRDTVIVHYGGEPLRGRHAPYLGHFVMKLITYLRMTGVKFEVFPQMIPSPKEKVPWIEYNEVTMGDSQLIINYMNKELGVDLNKNLTENETAIAWGLQKWLEEFTYWLNVQIRWVFLIDEFVKGDYLGQFWRKRFMKTFMRRKARKMLYFVGIGRHQPDEIYDMLKNDLTKLSKILGEKSYLFGDEPSQLDCTAFGILSQVRFETPDSCQGKQFLNNSDELRNLREYIDRIKGKYWPDWNDLLLKE